MNYNTIKVDNKNNILWVTIYRPNVLNALNSEFFDEFENFIDNISNTKCVVISGIDNSFVAGADISEFDKRTYEEAYNICSRGQRVFNKLANLSIPVIASINGYALGGGLELAMSCDIRIASNKAKFGLPEVSLGIIPGFTGTQRIPRLIGYSNAFYLITTGKTINAEQALQFGIVQQIVEHEMLAEETNKLVELIISKSPHAIKTAKKVLKETVEISYKDGLEIESKNFATCFKNQAHEGMRAFLEKRKPNWE